MGQDHARPGQGQSWVPAPVGAAVALASLGGGARPQGWVSFGPGTSPVIILIGLCLFLFQPSSHLGKPQAPWPQLPTPGAWSTGCPLVFPQGAAPGLCRSGTDTTSLTGPPSLTLLSPPDLHPSPDRQQPCSHPARLWGGYIPPCGDMAWGEKGWGWNPAD